MVVHLLAPYYEGFKVESYIAKTKRSPCRDYKNIKINILKLIIRKGNFSSLYKMKGVLFLITNYNEVIDTYGDKVLKTGLGHYMNARYEIWEDGALRTHSTDKELIMKDWKRIRTTEPMFKVKEKMPFMRW